MARLKRKRYAAVEGSPHVNTVEEVVISLPGHHHVVHGCEKYGFRAHEILPRICWRGATHRACGRGAGAAAVR
jgi:hypothetical protein